MRFHYKTRTTWIFIRILIFLLAFTIIPVRNICCATSDNQSIVILYDAGHGQVFNETHFSTAFEHLENMTDFEIEVRYSFGDFNSTVLSGVDILIVTNPGPKNSLIDPIDIDRQNRQEFAVANWFLQGNGLFLLTNPYDSTNSTLSGESSTLRRLVRSEYLAISGVNIRSNYVAFSPEEIIQGKPSIHEISNLSTSISPVLNKPFNVTNIKATSATVRVSTEDNVVGTEVIKAPLSSLAVASNGKVEDVDREPCIFATVEYSPNDEDYDVISEVIAQPGRLAISGSTLMFSNLLTSNETNSLWINQENNAKLWVNTILWLAKKTQAIIDVSSPTDDFPFELSFSALGVGVIILFSLGSGTFIYGSKKPLKPIKDISSIDIKEEKKLTKKPTKQIRRKQR